MNYSQIIRIDGSEVDCRFKIKFSGNADNASVDWIEFENAFCWKNGDTILLNLEKQSFAVNSVDVNLAKKRYIESLAS